MPYRYSRPIQPLPPADSLPFPGNVIRECTDCHLRQGCTAPVPGDGPRPAKIMLLGQNPGFHEDQEGKPFIGQAGQYLDSLLFQCGIPRSSVYITNAVKCLTAGNRVPNAQELRDCSKWLDLELEVVQPEIVVAMGAPAIAYFLGSGAGTVEHLHGKPVEVNGRIILPCYHPASALRDTSKLRQCSEDFNVLRGLSRGVPISDYHIKDEYPNPVYRIADTPEKMGQMRDEINEAGLFAIDTEICRGRLWSYQISTAPGTAWFVPVPEDFTGRIDLTGYDAVAIVHNYLFDVQYLKIDDDRFVDSMTMAYLSGNAQGLKELASRLCGITMKNYNEVVRPGQLKLSLIYLNKAKQQEWPDPPPIEETKWDNKKGCLVTKAKKPWHILRKIDKILKDMTDNPDTDPYDRWKSIPEEERSVVEGTLGVMPESSLMDIPLEQAVQYASRDADATIRVYHKLSKLVDDLGLNFVLDMDLKILPMVYNMMQNGMAVDVDHYRKLSVEYDARLRAKAAELAGMVGHPFNPNSSDQVATVIYKELGFKPTSMTPSGKISTDDEELKKVRHPAVNKIIEYRGILKLKSTYADALVEQAIPDERGIPRVHTTLKTTRVETGRLSCVPLDTEILTLNGWLRWYSVCPGMTVLGYDIVNAKLVWTTVRQIHRGRSVLGSIKLGRRRRPSELVRCTPNHKWAVTMKQYDKSDSVVPDLLGIIESRHLGNSRLLSLMTQPGSCAPDVTADSTDATPVEAGIIGWAITDGHIITTSSNRRCLSIRLRKPSSINAVSQLLQSIKHTKHIYNETDVDFYIGVSEFETIWSKFFNILRPERYVIGLSTVSRNAMFDAMMEADGNRDDKHNRWAKRKGSIAESIMELLSFLLGKRFTSRYYSTHNGALMREFHFLSGQRYNQNASYQVDDDELHEVWCPETDIGTWVMRQGRHVAVTGNSSNPNLQNIPTRNKEAKFIKNGFVAPAGKKLCEIDYSQIEMVTLAHLSGCKRLIDLFNRGGDPHTEMAATIFGVPLDEAKQDKYRYPVKRLNFGVAYLIGAQGLSNQINEYISDLLIAGETVEIEPWDIQTCEKFLAEWYALNPEVRDFQMEKVAEARRNGRVVDMFGRTRFIPEVMCPIRSIQEAGARQAANMPVTSTAQGIIKGAMGRLWRELPSTKWADDVRWLMQIHDSLIVEVTDDSELIREYLGWMIHIMTSVVKLRVPIRADAKVGYRWAEMEKFKLD